MIKVIGIGGGGCNILQIIMERKDKNIECMAANSDLSSLKRFPADNQIQLGYYGEHHINHFMKVCDYPSTHISNFKSLLSGADHVVIIACLGGQTGTRMAPVFAELSGDMKIPNHVFVTAPLDMESGFRKRLANNGIEKLSAISNELTIIPNQEFWLSPDRKPSVMDAFNYINLHIATNVCKLFCNQDG